jgi:Alpha amylase, catalytic domain
LNTYIKEMKPLSQKLILPFFAFFLCLNIQAQDFMLQGWYWDYPKTANGFSWVDTISNKVAALDNAGFTYVWLPPLSRASFGNNSNGYDPQDLYDLGIDAIGPTGFGTRSQLDALIVALNNAGINSVADVVYNHRDGGMAEDNPAVEGWIENMTCTKVNNGDQPFPSDRVRFYLPLGGSSGNGAGTYYFKIRSASKHPNYYGKPYKLYMQTNTVGYQNLPAVNENEGSGGNGGGDCGQSNNTITLGVDHLANIDNVGSCSGFCGIDEFALTVTASDFSAAGDTLWIFINNTAGYADQYIAGLWSASAGADIQNQIKYQTYTDFSNVPSGRGQMDYTFFKPNGNPTSLAGDWDQMYFFYDYDQQYNQDTKDSLNEWSRWLWDEVGIRGFRMDAVKHFPYQFTGDLLDFLHDNGIDPGMAVGEFFDTNASALNNWILNVESEMDSDTKAAIDIRVFDFALREALKNASDAFGYDVRNVFQSGLVDGAGANSYNVVTFLNNHDYRDAGQPVANDPMLGYTYLLTNNQIGLPTVFYADYYPVTPPNYPVTNLKTKIDELIDLHKNYIYNSTSADYLSRFSTPYSSNYIAGFPNTTLLYQLSGGIANNEVIVAINYAGETLKVDHSINTTNLAVGDTLFDVLGYSNFPYAIVSGTNQIYIELPARSYSVWINETPVPLPVELLRFSASLKNENVWLEWETATELNVKGFDLERSADGRTFEKITSQASIAANGGGASYSHLDESPPRNQNIYYRLKTVDLDGSFAYSDIQRAFVKSDILTAVLQPNPAQEEVALQLTTTKAEQITVAVFLSDGRLILSKQEEIGVGAHILYLPLEMVPQGMYLVKVSTGEELLFLKGVKK